MKVLCVNDKQWAEQARSFFGKKYFIPGKGPAYLDIDLVVDEVENAAGCFYKLEAWPEAWYNADGFIPLSDIDELQFERHPIKKTWPLDKALIKKI